MDLTVLTKAELDALQLAVNTEIGARLQRERAGRRMAALIDDATVHGVAPEDIRDLADTALAAATGSKRRTKERILPPTDEKTPPVQPRAARNRGVWRNTIDKNA